MVIQHTCIEVTLTSDLVQTFVDEVGYTLDIIPSLNGTVATTYSVALQDIVEGSLVLLPTMFGLSTWQTGIYGVRLNLTDGDGVVVYERRCFFSDCTDILCSVHAYQIDNTDSKVRNLYDALIDLENCGDCDCEYMLKAYNLLLSILNTPLTGKEDCIC